LAPEQLPSSPNWPCCILTATVGQALGIAHRPLSHLLGAEGAFDRLPVSEVR
jgi:hypothetical protein